MRRIATLLFVAVAAAQDAVALATFLDGALHKDPAVRKRTLEAWQAVRSGDDWRRAQELERAAVGPLVAALKDRQVWHRRGAAEALGVMAPQVDATIQGLASALDDEEAEVRLAGAEALGRLPGFFSNESFAPTIPALLRCLEDEDARVRSAALDDIGHFANSGGYGWPNTMAAYKRIGAILANSRHADPDVRASAAFALGRVGYWDPKVVARVTGLLEDGDARVRRAAASMLGNMRGHGKTGTSALRKRLTDEVFEVRLAAAYSLWDLTHESGGIVPVLREALRRSTGNDLAWPLSVLAEIGPPAEEAIPEIVKALGQTSYMRHGSTGREAVEAFFAIGPKPEQALPLLLEALAHERPSVRAAATAALQAVDAQHKKIASILVRAMKDPDARLAAIHALGRLDGTSPEILKVLYRSAASKDTWERAYAVESLGETGSSLALPVLLGALRDPRAAVRLRAAAALRRVGPPEAVPALVATLGDSDEEVRWESLRALARLGADSPKLRGFLQHPKPLWRIAAATAMRDKQHLAAALDDEEGSVRAAAARALGDLGARGALARVRELLKDDDPDVEIAAAYAVCRFGETAQGLPILMKHAPSGFDDAVVALGRIGPPAMDAVSVLIEVVKDAVSLDPKRHAIEALGKIGPAAKAAVPVLRLARRNSHLRRAATEALRRIE